MSTSNTNWRAGSERRGNLAMTAELALGGGSKNTTNMQNNPSAQGSNVPRVRGGDINGTNDILGSFKPSEVGGIGGSKGFGENKDFKPMNSGLSPRGYNQNNEFNNLNGLGNNISSNNNTTNQYKPFGGFGGNDVLNNFQTSNSNSSIGAESNGFKVQRVRGAAQAQEQTALATNQQFGLQTFGSGNNTSNNQTNFGFTFAKSNSNKDENNDIDYQTKQIKKEIDSLDQKLNFKQTTSTPIPDSLNQKDNNAFKSSATNFGSNNNINTLQSGKNFYSNNNSDTQSNQLTSTQNGSNNNIYGNGFGGVFGNSSSNNNINNNNNFNNFSSVNNNNNFNPLGNNLNQQNNTQNNKSQLPPRGRPPMAPTTNNYEDILGFKTSNNENIDSTKEIKKIPVNSGTFNNPQKNTVPVIETNQTKEFSTGTYDPSNILNQNRSNRMRSLGKNNTNQNQHEEKPAQATGNKNLPDQVPQLEEFLCPEGCGRTFNKKALAKHIPNCKKLFQPKKEETLNTKQEIKSSVPKKINDDNKQGKLQKEGVKKPASKDSKRPQQKDLKEQKNEALRKLKEQKKKELVEQKENEENEDDGLVNEPNENEYF